jgi:hypothetical protein
MALPLICLAVPLGLPFVATAALLGGMGAEAFEINWSIALQENVPVTLLSRVSAYDALGSYALGPVGTTVAGPLAALVGTTVALGGAGIAILVAVAVTLGLPDVRRLTRRVADTGAVIADVPLDPATGAIELRPASEGEVRDAAR